MTSIDKYSLVSFAPSVLIVATCVVLTVVGVRFLRKNIAKDAAAAGEASNG
ncbi:hypothetical protein [Marinobacterium rhizophilum]|uniref:hypothetical protein n=1 Tax=Marinobacterium rhizophilum TaxID=420402 RepID=UPI000379C772|nr:hypothetical protein [Marinobacterium rhizophilum]